MDTHPLALERPGSLNRHTVALSLAANRASKIALLRSDHSERCDEIADRYEAMLREDCRTFIATRRNLPPLFARALWEAAGLAEA